MQRHYPSLAVEAFGLELSCNAGRHGKAKHPSWPGAPTISACVRCGSASIPPGRQPSGEAGQEATSTLVRARAPTLRLRICILQIFGKPASHSGWDKSHSLLIPADTLMYGPHILGLT